MTKRQDAQVRSEEKAVRDAANALHEAVTNARAAGFRVTWPNNPDDLPALSVSETARVERTRVVAVAEEAARGVEPGSTVASRHRVKTEAKAPVDVVERTVHVGAGKEA